METKLIYRKANTGDVPSLITLRMDQLLEEGATPDTDLAPALFAYYEAHLLDGTFISWIAEDGGDIVATSGMSFLHKPPYYGNPTGKIGLLSNMYTKKEYRRKGIAKRLLEYAIEEARAHGCTAVHVTASDVGILLYEDFGFQRHSNFLQYRL
jgi:GNAT superfamily N-acetyltransferase